jgi:hypothetical protein
MPIYRCVFADDKAKAKAVKSIDAGLIAEFLISSRKTARTGKATAVRNAVKGSGRQVASHPVLVADIRLLAQWPYPIICLREREDSNTP